MHKKLFGLLATAVVGLTLTSCGGGGGGGGGGGESSVAGAGVQGAPNSVVGRTITQSFVGNATTKWEYTFTSEESFNCVVYLGNDRHMTFSGTYWYDRVSDGRAFLRDVIYVEGENVSNTAKWNDLTANYLGTIEDIDLGFDPQTGQLLNANGQEASMR